MPTDAFVEQLLSQKNNKEVDVSNLEKEIDNLVCLLYGLDAEEIALIDK